MKKFIFSLLLGLTLPLSVTLHAQDSLLHFQLDSLQLANASEAEGTLYVLDSAKAKKAIVLIFCSTSCSFCNNYVDRINTMAQEYAAQNVHFVIVNSNDSSLTEDDTFRGMQAANPFQIPYLHDADQSLAQLLEVTINPEALVLIPTEENFRLVYRGKIDNIPLNIPGVESQRKPFLANAIDDVLQAKSPLVPKTALGGCHIQWIDKEDEE